MKKASSFFISARNNRGILIFLVICIIAVFIPRILVSFQNDEEFKLSSEQIVEFREQSKLSSSKRSFSHFKKKTRKFSSPKSKFDPNTYSRLQWIGLGLSEKQADVVLSFTKRGIYSNEQLQKVFVIPAELYDLIKDSTYYPAKGYDENKMYSAGNQYPKQEKKSKILIDINSAEQEELETIPGVGPFFAKNILKLRDGLGGFYKKEQLLEVWKLDIEKYNAIEGYIRIDQKSVKMIALNEVSAEQLKSHPYMNWNIANSIIKIRNQKGKFKNISEIKESVLIDEELFEKIKPYLTL